MTDPNRALSGFTGNQPPLVPSERGDQQVLNSTAASSSSSGQSFSPPPIPDIVIRRLPIYVRTLERLAAAGVTFASSDKLAGQIGISAAQIRRDLSYFGRFGKQGKGYDTTYLAGTIGKILGLDREWTAALAGFGNLGRAIAQYGGFAPTFKITAIFDQNPARFGEQINGVAIAPLTRITDFVRAQRIDIGIVAVPAIAAQPIAEQMIEGGIRAILNYAPIILRVPSSVTVREIDPVSALQSMTFYLSDDRRSPS